MKRLMMAVAALMISATFISVKAQSVSQEPFKVDFSRLSNYLNLAPYQMTEVENINDYFIEKQSEGIAKVNPVRKEQVLNQALYGNLKLMKSVLSQDQYRRYVALINVTNNNNRILNNEIVLSDSFMANTK